MFYDLSLPVEAGDVQTFRERVATAIRLGYDCVAQTRSVDISQLTKATTAQLRPLAGQVSLASASAAIPGVSWPSRSLQSRTGASSVARATTTVHSLSSSGGRKDASNATDGTAGLYQLSRLSVNIPDATQAALLNSCPELANFDLVAACAGNEKAFDAACRNLDVDIISFDMTKRLPFRMNPASIAAAVARGVYFEICYSAALRGATERCQLFTNAQAILRATRKRGLLLSSGASRAQELRNPYDVACIATLWGVDVKAAKDMLSAAPRAVIARARARRAIQGVSIRDVVSSSVHPSAGDASIRTGDGAPFAALEVATNAANELPEARPATGRKPNEGREAPQGALVSEPVPASHLPVSTSSQPQQQALPGEGAGKKNKKKRKRGRDRALAAALQEESDDALPRERLTGSSGGPRHVVAFTETKELASRSQPVGDTASAAPGGPVDGVQGSPLASEFKGASALGDDPPKGAGRNQGAKHELPDTSTLNPGREHTDSPGAALASGMHGAVAGEGSIADKGPRTKSSIFMTLATGNLGKKGLAGRGASNQNSPSKPAKRQALTEDFIEFD
eukprot:jgi/Mesvir1/2831/Mv13923-RA.1